MSQVRRFDQIPAANLPVSGTDEFPVFQQGRTRRMTAADLAGTVDKAGLGLDRVNNTSDADKVLAGNPVGNALAAIIAAIPAIAITRDQLSGLGTPLSSVRLAGYATAGDVGAGAIYTRSATQGLWSVAAFGGGFWNLTFPSDVFLGHFGVTLGGDDTAAMKAAGDYAVLNRKAMILPAGVVNISSFQPVFPVAPAGTPPVYSEGKLVMRGQGAGVSIIRKLSGGDPKPVVQVGDIPSTSIKREVVIEELTIDGRSSATYAGLALCDVWGARTCGVEIINCKFGRITYGCIYVNHERANCRLNDYGAMDTKLDQSFYPLPYGPSNSHTHVNCLYTFNRNRGVIVDYGAMHLYLNCSIEYNGSELGNADHGGFYGGDNMGTALPGTVGNGIRFVSCWFEENRGLEAIRFGSGSNAVEGCNFIGPPNLTTYGIHAIGGRLSISNGTVFAASYPAGNVKDETGLLTGNRIEYGCSLYNVFLTDPKKWVVERVPGSGATVRGPAAFSVPNDTSPPPAIPWTGATVDNANGYFNPAQPTRLTVPVAGLYRVSAYVRMNVNGVGVRQFTIARNGAFTVDDAQDTRFGGGTLPMSSSLPALLVQANAGDYFEVFAYQNSGAAQNVTGGLFQLEYVR